MRHLFKNFNLETSLRVRNYTFWTFSHSFRFYSNPITPIYGTINVFRINMDPGIRELVLRVEFFLFASSSLCISQGTPDSSKMGRKLCIPVYPL